MYRCLCIGLFITSCQVTWFPEYNMCSPCTCKLVPSRIWHSSDMIQSSTYTLTRSTPPCTYCTFLLLYIVHDTGAACCWCCVFGTTIVHLVYQSHVLVFLPRQGWICNYVGVLSSFQSSLLLFLIRYSRVNVLSDPLCSTSSVYIPYVSAAGNFPVSGVINTLQMCIAPPYSCTVSFTKMILVRYDTFEQIHS